MVFRLVIFASSIVLMNSAELETDPKHFSIEYNEASWLLRENFAPHDSAVQSASSTPVQSRNRASRIVGSTHTLIVQPAKTSSVMP